jgi:predicted nucleotidyltransferase
MTTRDTAKVAQMRLAVERTLDLLGMPVQAVYVHGSWASPWARDDSDIDLAILCQAKLSFDDRSNILRELHDLAPASEGIDLADLRSVDSVFAAQVITEGERMITRDRDAAEHFEMITLAKYTRLNEERSAILADIFSRGTIYASGVRV